MLTSFVLFSSMLTACGDKSASTPAAAAESGPKITMAVPDGGKAFVSTLIGAVTKNFEPTDADGASFMYTELQFRGDGSWMAQGYVEAQRMRHRVWYPLGRSQQQDGHHRLDCGRHKLRRS